MNLLIKPSTRPIRKSFKPTQRLRFRGGQHEWFVLDPVSHAVLDRGASKTKKAARMAASAARKLQTELFRQ